MLIKGYGAQNTVLAAAFVAANMVNVQAVMQVGEFAETHTEPAGGLVAAFGKALDSRPAFSGALPADEGNGYRRVVVGGGAVKRFKIRRPAAYRSITPCVGAAVGRGGVL